MYWDAEVKVRITLSLRPESIDAVLAQTAALANRERLLGLFIIRARGRMSLNEFHREAHRKGIYANPETSYRNLEILTRAGFLRKEYDQNSKTIYYRFEASGLEVVDE